MKHERSRPSAAAPPESRQRPKARAMRARVAWLLGALLVLTAGVAALVDRAEPPFPAARRASTESPRQPSRPPSTRPPSGAGHDERSSAPQHTAATLEGSLDAAEPELRGAHPTEAALPLGWWALGAEVIDPSLAPTGEDTGIIIVPGAASAADPDKDDTPLETPPAVAPEPVEHVDDQPAPEWPRSRPPSPGPRPDANPPAIDTGTVVTPARAQPEPKR